MKPLTEQVHDFLSDIALQGETVIDATAGNGYDTFFLAQCVGSQGKVFAIDIQQEAIDQTNLRLTEAGYNNATCIKGSHSELLSLLPENLIGKVAAITFNLGYLPGGNKAITTQIETTLIAIDASIQLLKPGGILTILAYTGHPGGKEEADSIVDFGNRLSANDFIFHEHSPTPLVINSPRFFVIQKR